MAAGKVADVERHMGMRDLSGLSFRKEAIGDTR